MLGLVSLIRALATIMTIYCCMVAAFTCVVLVIGVLLMLKFLFYVDLTDNIKHNARNLFEEGN